MVTIHIFWTMIEVGVALIAICLPLFRPGQLLAKNHWIQRWVGSFSGKLTRSRRTHPSRGQSIPDAVHSKRNPFSSSEDEAERSLSKSANTNMDYQIAEDSMQDVELVERDFKGRYEQLFPSTTMVTKANPTHMV